MNVLVACEESQAVCKAFREKGHRAFSCDLQECSGGHPEWHIQKDVLEVLSPVEHGNNYLPAIWFSTVDMKFHEVYRWDLIIAHPPCTYLTVTGNRWFSEERYGDKAIRRKQDRQESIDFFMKFVNADCERIAIENPIGVMSTVYRKPDQIIQPYYFGDPYRKGTCLWLKGLPKLKPTEICQPKIYYYKASNGKIKSDSRYRSWKPSSVRAKTFPGIAKAMAEQWG